MCGIAGIYRYGQKPISEETIALLLSGNEHRGNDATGMAFLQADGSVQVSKLDVPAWKFTCSEQYEKFVDTYLKKDTVAVILHARGASQGSPRINGNNHPMHKDNTAVIHNGMIHNDSEMFNKLNLVRNAETDSDILRAIFDEYGFTDEAFKHLNKLEGSIAGAAISPKYPGKLVLFKSGSPMAIASNKDHFMFSSERKTIYQAMRPVTQRFKLWFQAVDPDLAFSFINEHTLWVLGPEGQERHIEFKTCKGSYSEPVRMVYDRYNERQEKFDADAAKSRSKGSNEPKIVKTMRTLKNPKKNLELHACSNPKCSHQWTIDEGDDPSKFVCNMAKNGCGAPLAKQILKIVTVN
jgi:predicted glutamine amidotransferase